MSASGASRQTRRYERKREEILGAAAHLFNTKGLKGTTLNDVAQRVDLITTSITYYYKKKEDLAAACYVLTLQALNAVVDVAEKLPTPRERIETFFARYFEMLAEIARGDRAELVNFYDLRGFAGHQRTALLRAYEDLFKRVRRLIRVEGRHNQLENNARTHLFYSVILWARTWVREYETEDYPRAGARMCDILLNGLAAKGANWAPPELCRSLEHATPSQEPGPDAFLHAATKLVNLQGYHGASVERISAMLNVTKGSFYHHIDAKDDLVAECFKRSFATIRKVQHAAMELKGSGWTQLAAASAELIRYQFAEQGPLLRYTALAAAPDAMRPELTATMRRLTDRFASIIVDGVADGSIRPVDPAIAAQLVDGMINAAADLAQWAPGADIDNAPMLYARPLFYGVLAD